MVKVFFRSVDSSLQFVTRLLLARSQVTSPGLATGCPEGPKNKQTNNKIDAQSLRLHKAVCAFFQSPVTLGEGYIRKGFQHNMLNKVQTMSCCDNPHTLYMGHCDNN